MAYQDSPSGPSSGSTHSHSMSTSHAHHSSFSQSTHREYPGGPLQDSLPSFSSLRGLSTSSYGDTLAMSDSHQNVGLSSGASALTTNTSQILISSIVQRLVKRLPCNSGGRLSSLEEEELVRSSVANLVFHSKYQLAVVVRELLLVLESLNKQLSQLTTEDFMRIDIMQSQLFTLQVLVACLIHSWKQSLKGEDEKRARGNDLTGLAKGWKDPPALEDSLAKQILSVMTFYLRLTVAREDDVLNASTETNINTLATAEKSKMSKREEGGDKDGEGISSSDGIPLAALALSNGTGLFILHPTFPPSRSPFQLYDSANKKGEDLPRFNPDSSQSVISPSMSSTKDRDSGNVHLIIQSIYRQASQVIFFLSSSNWPVVFARIRNRLSYLSTTLEESPNTSELRLLECSNLQRARLGSVLQELCTTFLHLKRSAQQTIALVLRRTIQAWIQYHPAEFAHLFASNRRLEGGPELLFDHVYNLADSTRKRIVYWPMMTSLLILCPDIVSKIAVDDGRKGGSLGKKNSFFTMLKKGLRSSKLSDVSALCCVDICNAATSCSKADSALRLLVPDLESDLKEKLFDPKKPMVSSMFGIVEIPLMVNAFVAFYRLEPQKTMRDLVPILMNDSSPIAFKTTLVKGCIQLASEGGRLPWDPPVSLLYPLISSSLRTNFKEVVFILKKSTLPQINPSTKRSISLRNKSAEEELANRQELLQAILQLWHIDIEAACHGMYFTHPTTLSSLAGTQHTVFDGDALLQNAMAVDSVVALMYVINRAATTTSDKHIHIRASNLIQFCVKDHDQHVTFFQNARESLISCASQFTQRIAGLLMSSETTNEQQHWLTNLQIVTKLKFFILDSLTAISVAPSFIPNPIEVKHEKEKVEMALLLTICSADTDICSLALQTCKQTGRLDERSAKFFDLNVEWNRLFQALGELELVQTGRIAQQKRVRACLREMTTCTGSTYAAWREAYQRWTFLTQIIAKPLQEESNEAAQEKAAQWHNFAGFLAALGGSCAVEQAPELQQVPGSSNSNSFIGKDESPLEYVENFIQEMVDLLVSDSIWVREKAKEILGADTSPRLNGILFRMIHSVLSDFFDKTTGQPQTSDMYTIFVEHSISVMQMTLARMPVEPTEATLHVDIGALMILFVEYLNSLTKQRDQAARVRALMCQLCEQLMQKKNHFTFHNELRVRNRLFQVLGGWTTESIEDTSSTEKIDRLQRDLDVTCLRTMSILLNRLPLLLAEDIPLLDDSVEWAKSRQFSTCFNYFIKVLNRAKAIEQSVVEKSLTPSTTSAATTLIRSRESQSLRDLVPLKQSAIVALSNLLASNISTGLHHSLPLAYQDDLQLRTAFMQIMTNVLNQGIAFDDLERLTASQKQSKLIELISEPDLQLALSICQVCRGYDIDSMDSILLNVFDSRGGIIQFLKAALSEEIRRTTSEEMVFRSNSFRTHLLSLFGKTHGYEYLRSIMAPLITEMANKPKGYSFEIDTQKLDPSENALVNQHRLEDMAQAFIDQICNSAHRVPAVLRELCRHIRFLMDQKFPNSRYQGVGGFIFLRFINPAVVAPQMIDIHVTGSGKELRRGLLLISKILQTLASNTLFPQHKEPFMTGLNDFLKKNVWKVTTFLDQVSDSRTDPDRLLAADQPLGFGIHPSGYGLDNDDQLILHKFFYENVDKIGKELLTRTLSGDLLSSSPVVVASGWNATSNASSSSGSRSKIADALHHGSSDGKKVYENLCIVMAEMGDYRQEEVSAVQDANPQAVQEFMRRHNGRSIDNDEYRQIFREGPKSKAGRPVYYYNCWAQNAQTLDYEGFIHYVLHQMQPCMSQTFDIVFDCTGVQPNNLTPLQWLTYFINLLPVEFAMNVRNMFGFNVNTICRMFTQTWANNATTNRSTATPQSNQNSSVLHHLQANMNVVYCSNLNELEAYIDRRNIALDSRTISISSSPGDTRFDQVTMVWYYRTLIPVTFKLSNDYLQITALKPQVLFKGSNGFLNEVFHLADIDDVRAISIRGDDNTFFVTCRGGTSSFLFISRDREDIVQSLRQAKARVSRFDNAPHKGIDRTLLPSDVPGTLLNMAMLNITSQDHQLRLSAYDLLCALSTSFNFGASNARKKLLSTKGLALSANAMTFVAELSRDFAIAAPGVTLEFLSSFFEGFERANPSQKTACLQYMAPWLSNLVMFTHTSRNEQREYQKRIKEILSHLIALTVKQPDLYATMQRIVWSQVSRMDELIPIVLDVFFEAAMDSGMHTERFDSVLDTMVSFASINLRGKLLAKLRRSISKTAQNVVVAHLHENVAWKEIATLVRMNMVLSFTSKVETLLYLPELLHVILLLAGNGSDAIRHSIHGTAINLVHSLCTGDSYRDPRTLPNSVQIKMMAQKLAGAASSISTTTNEVDADDFAGKERLRSLLIKLSNEESLTFFGLATDAASISTSPFDASPTMVRESPNNQSIAQLASVMYQIVEIAAPNIDTSNAWRARLTSLVTSTAFQYNPVIQSRAFILLGCLADLTGQMLDEEVSKNSPDAVTLFEVDDDLLYQILVSLRGSIQEWASVANDAPIISIVTCLSKVVKILPDKSRYLPKMFWLGVSIIQYGHIPLFKSGVDLLISTVKSIYQRNLPERTSTDLLSFLLDGRFEFREEAIRLDDETGVDFDTNFSFAMASLLVKGLRHPLTRDATIELLRCMLQYSAIDAQGNAQSVNGEVSTVQLGFFIALLPTATKDHEFIELLQMAGAEEESVQYLRRQSLSGSRIISTVDDEAGLYAHLQRPLDNKMALLVITLLASLLQHSTVSDPEKQQLYRFLADSAKRFPAIVSILYDFLLPNIKELYLNCQNEDILKSVDIITKVAISEPIFQLQFQETKKRGGAEAYLEESGYASLLDCGNFSPLKDSRRVTLAKLSTALLGGLIDAGTA